MRIVRHHEVICCGRVWNTSEVSEDGIPMGMYVFCAIERVLMGEQKYAFWYVRHVILEQEREQVVFQEEKNPEMKGRSS